MLIKTNENTNKINIPQLMNVNQKAGVFFSKQQRTKQLQQQNIALSKKLEQTLIKFQQRNQYLKHIITKNNATQNLLQVTKVENDILVRENQNQAHRLEQLTKQKQELTGKQKLLTSKMIDIQKTLFENTKKYQDNNNLLQRYQQQLKNQKTIRLAPDSINNIVAKLQKELQLLKRNIVIHQNKLQGKKKYLTLLQKKKQQQLVKQQKIKQNSVISPKKLNIYQKSTNLIGYANSNKKINSLNLKDSNKEENLTKFSKQDKKDDIKKFNQLTRKKNAMMLANNGSKKKF